MVSFLYPAFLFGLAAAAVPVVLHLLRREAAPRLAFSAVRFLRRAPVEQTRRKRLRDLLLLALRVAALALLALAFARPYLTAAGAATAAGITVIAVDTSFSMSAPGQFAAAREHALSALDRVAPSGAVAVVAFHDGADVLVGPTMDRGLARAAIARLSPGFGATRYRALVTKAASVVDGRSGRLVVVTDLQRTGWDGDGEAGLPPDITVEVVDAGAPTRNLAVAAVSGDAKGAAAVVLNSGDVGDQARVALAVDGRTVNQKMVSVPAGQSVEVRFDGALPRSGTASVSVEDSRGYAADNVRHLLLDPPQPTDVVVIAARGLDEAFYMEKALAAGGEDSSFRLRTSDAAALAPRAGLPPAAGPGARREAGSSDLAGTSRESEAPAVAVLLNTRGLDRAARERVGAFLRGGGGVLVAAGDRFDAAALGDQLGGRVFESSAQGRGGPYAFAPVDARHPVFRAFGALTGSLGQVRFERFARIPVRDDDRVLSRFTNGAAALVERRVGAGRLLIFASDLGNRWNDFPRHPTFVPFVHETMRYLAQERRLPRELLIADLPADTPRTPGVATIGRARVAVNVDPRESGTAQLAKAEFERLVGRSPRTAAAGRGTDAREREQAQRLWQYGLALMIAALVTEGLLGSRMA